MELECRVSIEGHSEIRHVLTVRAKSVFHAAGKALQTFRANSSTASLVNDAASLTVEAEGRSYRVMAKRVDAWVQSSSRSPAEHARKMELRPKHTRR
jgi:hypothetical protein